MENRQLLQQNIPQITITIHLMNKTKIIATLGPNSQTVEQVMDLIKAGMDVARINLSHGERESHLELINLVKTARKKLRTGTAILLDTRGPEIRIADLEAPIDIVDGQRITITQDESSYSQDRIGVNYTQIAEDVKVGGKILLDDGKLSLQVEEINGSDIVTKVIAGGRLTSRKRVALPEVAVNLPSLSEKDADDIAFGVKQHVDFIAASFVRRADDVWAVRHIIENEGGSQAIIAKIETRQGVDNVDEILGAADGLMVARGDLGVELPAEEVPVIQKRIIKASNRDGKPVITATQMLESMIHNPTPTRAEANDVTNAIFDGTDAVMLSAETAVGKYPYKAIRFMARCATIAESSLDYEGILAAGLRNRRPIVTDAISYASCATAADLSAAAIITATNSGSTARMVARYRPKAPVIAVSPVMESLRQLQVIRGVIPLPCSAASSMDEQLDKAIHAATQENLIQNGDLVVITAGMPLQTSGTTNMLKVHTVEDICLVGQGIGQNSAEGVVLVIDSEKDLENITENSIIVVTTTNSDMLPYLPKVKGIIAEQPGLTSHAAMIGRELNIPTICDVSNATTNLQNGQKITIDCATGHISYDDTPSA